MVTSLADFYDRHPYPPPRDDLAAYRRAWDERRRYADAHLFWPGEAYREDRHILVAGCGTMQAAHYALRWPQARVVGIDVSANSLDYCRGLKEHYRLDNLELRLLPVERAGELEEAFDSVVCTGVLHHLTDPDAGLRALRDALAPRGALHLMVYAPYGRAGVYLLQEYCRRLGIGATREDIRDLAGTLKALPTDHALTPLLLRSPDFSSVAGLADALLHPHDRAYAVPELLDFLVRADLSFGRWVRGAPYSPWCGALAASPHRARLAALPLEAQYAALELFRGTMVRHSLIAYRSPGDARENAPDFAGEAWLGFTPIRLPNTIEVRERVPAGATVVLINRDHTETDLYLPITARQEELLCGVDGKRTIDEICPDPRDRELARTFFEQLWRWDQIVFALNGRPSA
jgi:SAM-dependent methyltransferase